VRDALSPAYGRVISDTLCLSYNQFISDTLLLSHNQFVSGTLLRLYNQFMGMLRSGLRRRGRTATQGALACNRGTAACPRYRAAVVRAVVPILYRHLSAIFFGRRGDKRVRATENLSQLLLLPPLLFLP
jgi:hypothetical protein